MAEQTPKDQAPVDKSRLDRARRRAIRAHAAQAGVAYSVAARQLANAGIGPGESLASYGRTVYPVDVAGRWTLIGRELRAPAERLGDARLAARLPGGRARHLAERFPPGGGRAGDFYAGDRLSVTWRSLMTPGEDAAGEPYVVRAPWHGVRQVLDALLVVAEDGHAPGTRIRLAQPNEAAPDARREGTIVGVDWGPAGP